MAYFRDFTTKFGNEADATVQIDNSAALNQGHYLVSTQKNPHKNEVGFHLTGMTVKVFRLSPHSMHGFEKLSEVF